MNGVIIFDNGSIVPFGEIRSAAGLIAAMQSLIPNLQEQERTRVLNELDTEALEKALADRKANTGNTERLEP